MQFPSIFILLNIWLDLLQWFLSLLERLLLIVVDVVHTVLSFIVTGALQSSISVFGLLGTITFSINAFYGFVVLSQFAITLLNRTSVAFAAVDLYKTVS